MIAATAGLDVEALYNSHAGTVRGYLLRRLHDQDAVDDLAADVWLRAVRGAGTYQDRGVPAGAWLMRITHNILVDHLRRLRAQPTRVALEDADHAVTDGDPETMALAQDAWRALERLPSRRTVAVLVWQYRDGASYADCARQLGTSAGGVKGLRHRGLLALRRWMEAPACAG